MDTIAPPFAPTALLLVVREYLQQHVQFQFWARPDDIRRALDPSDEGAPIDAVFADSTYRIQMPLSLPGGWTVELPKCIRLDCKNATYRLVAEIVPEFNPSKYLLALTDEHTIVLLMLTDGAAIHSDGTVQIHGATPSVAVITPKTLRSMKSKVFVGSDTLVSITTEERELGGPWRSVTVPVAIPRTLLRDDGPDPGSSSE